MTVNKNIRRLLSDGGVICHCCWLEVELLVITKLFPNVVIKLIIECSSLLCLG